MILSTVDAGLSSKGSFVGVRVCMHVRQEGAENGKPLRCSWRGGLVLLSPARLRQRTPALPPHPYSLSPHSGTSKNLAREQQQMMPISTAEAYKKEGRRRKSCDGREVVKQIRIRKRTLKRASISVQSLRHPIDRTSVLISPLLLPLSC